MDRSDCLVFGLSVAGAAAALRLAESGRSVTLIELPNEVPLRARTLVWGTPLSQRDRTGADFESLTTRTLDKAGVHVVRDVESASLDPGASPLLRVRQFEQTEDLEFAAARAIYASDGIWNVAEMPPSSREWIGKGVSASAWVDSTFYIGKSAAVIGAGDFAYEQLYWAGQCVSELWWLCPEPKAMISEDLMHREELPVTPKLRTSVEVKAIRREGGLMHCSLASGESVAVHGVFFALPPHHDWAKLAGVNTTAELAARGIPVAGVAAGVPWTHYAGAWQSGLDAA